MSADLQVPEAAGLTACELVELLAEREGGDSGRCCKTTWTCGRHGEEEAAREHATPVAGADGITRPRLETGHGRHLATLFGAVRITRCAWRRPGAGNVYPADAALSLPASRHSHSLARMAVLEAVRGSFGTAHAAITGRCGPVIGKLIFLHCGWLFPQACCRTGRGPESSPR